MPKLWQGIMAIHDMSGFGHIGRHIPGLPFYADRALLLPADAAVVMDDGEDLEAYLHYLRTVRIGPAKVIRVRERNLFDGLEADPAAMEALNEHLRRGGMLQVFCMTPGTEAFLERNGINPRFVYSAPREIAQRMNDKAELRRIAHECGLPHAVLPHVASRDPQTVMAAVKAFLAKPESEAEFVVVKRTNLAGGDGFMRLGRGAPEGETEERVRAYLREHSWNALTVTAHAELKRFAGRPIALDRADIRDIGRDAEEGVARVADTLRGLLESHPEADYVLLRNVNVAGEAAIKFKRGQPISQELRRFLLDHCRNEILVEAGFVHDAYSTQIVVDHGSFRFLGPTKQIVDHQGRHMGNIMVRFYDGSLAAKGLTEMDKQVMESFSYDLTRYAHTRVEGYRGVIGFDFMKRTRDGAIFLLECNARQTAATYPLGVSAQLDDGRFQESFNAPKAGRVNWGVIMHNAVPTTARSWGALTEKLGRLLFNGKCGALPFNVRLMRLEHPHIGVVAVGKTLDQAYAVMRLARRKLA